MKKGFTLLEVLVASVLMGMLVTILTMIFNQSAIAWRTGKAGVADMSKTERNMARYHFLADCAIPTDSGTFCVASPWKISEEGKSSPSYNFRGVVAPGSLNLGLPSGVNLYQNDKWLMKLDDADNVAGGSAYIVGVKSSGPDRHFGEYNGQNDDITTLPEKE